MKWPQDNFRIHRERNIHFRRSLQMAVTPGEKKPEGNSHGEQAEPKGVTQAILRSKNPKDHRSDQLYPAHFSFDDEDGLRRPRSKLRH